MDPLKLNNVLSEPLFELLVLLKDKQLYLWYLILKKINRDCQDYCIVQFFG